MTDAAPVWIRAKHSGICGDCRRVYSAGARVVQYPVTRWIFCAECGANHVLRVNAESERDQ